MYSLLNIGVRAVTGMDLSVFPVVVVVDDDDDDDFEGGFSLSSLSESEDI